jgi:large subunit ribosomal protein L5
VTDETMTEETSEETTEEAAVETTDEPTTAVEATVDETSADEEPAAEQATDTADATVSEASAETAESTSGNVSEAAQAPAEEATKSRRQSSRSKKAEVAETESAPSAGAGGVSGLRTRYQEEIIATLTKEFGYTNPNQVPRLEKIVVNIGLGEALTNAKALDAAVGDLAQITGQKPIVTRARRSIAQFRLRTGNPIGAKVTLRGQRMWDFLERLTRLALPRIRDFRGVPSKSFDGRGNYSLGLREQLAFPEIDYDKIDRLRGLEVSIVTTAKTDEESKRLLQLLGMPFAGQNG